ncbi:MAG: hypothetical protein RL181_2627 [Bacteroidota bacterium]|jgi:hypothetical protein
MNYLLTVRPEKESGFLELLRSLQELDAIEYFSVVDDRIESSDAVAFIHPGMQETCHPDPAEQYRDLVD